MGKTVLVTGTTAGIGRAVAEEFAKLSYKVIISGRRETRLKELKKYLEEEYKAEVYTLLLDVSERKMVKNAFAGLPDEWKQIDILVNNAGLGLGFAPFDKADVDDWDTMIDTNVKGVLYVSKEVVAGMVERKSGHIINIGSTVAKQVPKNVSIYAATKHALNAITQGMRAELLEHDIKVTQVNPGYVETEFALVSKKGNAEEAKKVYEGFKPLEPKDIADTVVYVATLPENVNINDILITPLAEADVFNENRGGVLPQLNENKGIALVTGASSGIGKATARQLAERGFDIIITGRRKERLDKFAAELKEKYGIDVLSLNFDIRKQAEVDKAIENLPEKWKNIDVLVNNAGLAAGADPIYDGLIDDWERMIDTNIKGLLYISKKVMPLMMKRKTGHIVNIGSIAGKQVYPNGNVYCASKFAVDALTKGMRIDLLKHNIRVTQIAPGAVETEFSIVRYHGDKDKADKVYEGYTPLFAGDIANAVLFAVTRPAHVNVADVLIMPKAQANPYYWNKKL
jgi:NADP-dependent 3-hydroxy acid dehydrogenase YdfG